MTVLSNYDMNYTDKPQISPFVDHMELGSRVPLTSFEGNRSCASLKTSSQGFQGPQDLHVLVMATATWAFCPGW